MTKLIDIFPGIDAEEVLKEIGAFEIVENGDELVHSCRLPFGLHKNGDTNPSSSLNRETLLFNCFTCGGGSVIWLVQNCLEITKEEAIHRLLNLSSNPVDLTSEEFEKRLKKLFTEEEAEKIDIPVYNKRIVERFAQVCDYLTDRGVSPEVQIEMGTGLETGRVEMVGPGKTAIVDRVIIPHYMNGKLVGWVARKTKNIEGASKYKNSKGFPRNYWLFNLDKAKAFRSIYVVESPMSVLVLKSRGIENVVATFGAKVSRPQLKLLRDFEEVIVFMDGDSPGRAAKAQIVSGLRDFTKVSIIDTPDGEDPASLTEIPDKMSSFVWELSSN